MCVCVLASHALQGSGGLEVHFKSNTDPFDMVHGEHIDVDAVFKHEYDQSTYSLYIGCGGCVPMVDPIVILPMSLNGYQHGEVEPFTGTAYRSVFPKAQRKFNASELLDCDQGHFSIRIVDHHNRSDGSSLVWGAVIGLGETFTFTELLMYPIFILRNHGSAWNQGGWTFWVILPLSLPIWWSMRSAFARYGVYWLSPFDEEMRNEPRAWLYDLAIVGFLAASLELFVHLVYAQSMAALGYQLWIGLLVVILFANGFPVMIIMFTWRAMYHREERWVSADWRWAPVEMLIAFSYLFLLGAGFYVGPVLVFMAAVVRFVEDGFGFTGWRQWVSKPYTLRNRGMPYRAPVATPVMALPMTRAH